MCLQDERAGFIVYAAQGDSNCTVRGAASSTNGAIRITPNGDNACTIDVRTEGGAVILGRASTACAYYCGPNASFAGRRLQANDAVTPAVDLAGDPLC